MITETNSGAVLAPYAATESQSRGRGRSEEPPAFRSQFQRDRDRIIHCSAFRRLEYKTQVFVNHEGDMFRTRLTHSLEVAQIARTVARALSLNEDLTEAIALAHDLGHTPFGHAGQNALNKCMQGFGGFEHNRQGILKHCSVEHAQSLGELGLRFLKGTQPSLEAQLANVADEIAYNHHDIDDGLRANLLSLEQLLQFPLFRELHGAARRRWHDTGSKMIQHSVIREMLNYFVVDLIRSTRTRLEQTPPQNLDEVRGQRDPIVDFSQSVRDQHLALKRLLRRDLYHHERVLRNANNARVVVSELFDAFFDDPQLLPQERVHGQIADDGLRAQVIADYVAGMTDRFAIAEHKRIFHHEQFIVA